MLSQNVGVDGSRSDLEMFPQQRTEARGIQQGAGADDARRRESGNLCNDGGDDVHRIGGDDEQRVRSVPQDLGDDRLKNLCVSTQKLQAGLACTLRDAAGQNNGARSPEIREITCDDPHRLGKRGGVQDVLGMRLRQLRVEINEDDLAGHSLDGHGVCRGTAHKPTADDADFHEVHSGH